MEGLMGGNIIGIKWEDGWSGGGWKETVCHHSMDVHGVGGQAGWPETVEEDVERVSVEKWVPVMLVMVKCSIGGWWMEDGWRLLDGGWMEALGT